MEKELEELRLENAKLKAELEDRQEYDFKVRQMEILEEIRTMLRRMEYQQQMEEVENRLKQLEKEQQEKDFEIKCCVDRKVRLEENYWKGRPALCT